jgi:hypothetical protein
VERSPNLLNLIGSEVLRSPLREWPDSESTICAGKILCCIAHTRFWHAVALVRLDVGHPSN